MPTISLIPKRYPVLSKIEPGELVDALPRSGPEQAEPMEAILKDFEDRIVPAITHWNNPGFMGYFAVTATGPGILGEMLAAALNANGMLWKTSPAVTELEQVTLAWLRQWLGLPDPLFGVIFDTASTGVMHAIAAAREAADPGIRVAAAPGPGSLHFRACAQLRREGRDRHRDRTAERAKDSRRLRISHGPSALVEAIERDRAAGLRPFCVVPTVGTTSTSSIDPVPAIADVAERFGLWMHVDAAYGGSAALAPEFRHVLAGAERADSLIVNPHKWMGVPIDLSVLYTRKPEVFKRAFSLVPEFLRTAEDSRVVNLMDYGVPLAAGFAL